MIVPEVDRRSPARRALDEQIAAEPKMAPPELPSDAAGVPLEVIQKRSRRPLALAGVVENGMVRTVDRSVKLPEHSRVIIVLAEGA